MILVILIHYIIYKKLVIFQTNFFGFEEKIKKFLSSIDEEIFNCYNDNRIGGW